MPKKVRRSLRQNKLICSQCNLEVKEDDEYIECDRCSQKYHVVCTSLNKREYEHLLRNEEEEFACHLCDTNSGTLKKDLMEIKTELKKLDQLSHVQEAINFMSQQFDDLLKGVADNKKKIEAIQKENTLLKEEVKTLQNSVKFLSHQMVKNDCLIRGINYNEGMSAEDTVVKLSGDNGVILQPESIADAYFIKQRNNFSKKNGNLQNVKQTLVVKFTSKKAKNQLMSIKPKLRESESTKQVFINDYLSKSTMDLLRYARSLHKVGYHSTYSVDGRIFVKKSEHSKPKLIRSENEVDQLLLEAATIKHNQGNTEVAPDEEV